MTTFSRTAGSVFLTSCLALGLSGCVASLSPLAKHANAFSSATILVTNGASNAYTKAEQLHDNAQMALAAFDYDKKATWNPGDYVKPLLSDNQLQARLSLLQALKVYSETIADLTSGGKKTDLNAAATGMGSNLQSLSNSVSTSFATSVPGITPMSDDTKNGLSVAVRGLGDFLSGRKIMKSLPKVIEDNDQYISAICTFLADEIVILRRQADVDYGRVIDAQDQFIRHSGSTLSASEHRSEIQRLPQLFSEKQRNDELLSKLQSALRSLSLTHHAFAAAAQGNNPETLKQKIADLYAEGQSLASYYQILSSSTTTN